MGEGSIAMEAGTVNTTVCYRHRVDNDLITVFTAQGEPEETQVRLFLEAHGIPTTTRGEALRKTHGLTLDGLGAVEILVGVEYADDARRLLADVERGDFTIDG
jgi:hypothetical protein